MSPYANCAHAMRPKREIRCMDLGDEALGSRKASEGGCTQIQVRRVTHAQIYLPARDHAELSFCSSEAAILAACG